MATPSISLMTRSSEKSRASACGDAGLARLKPSRKRQGSTHSPGCPWQQSPRHWRQINGSAWLGGLLLVMGAVPVRSERPRLRLVDNSHGLDNDRFDRDIIMAGLTGSRLLFDGVDHIHAVDHLAEYRIPVKLGFEAGVV